MVKRLVILLLWFTTAAVAEPQRVVTLAPNLTELAFAAGITPVGVSDYSDYPPAAKKIEHVASWQGINTERLLKLKPDVVVAWRGGTPVRQMDQLQALGIRVLWLDPDSIAQLAASLRQLASWSPTPRQAENAAVQLEQQFDTLRQRYIQVPRKRVFLQFGMKPLFTAAGNTLQNEILELCGGVNIFADSKVPWPQVSREQVLARHPQAIVTPGNAASIRLAEQFWHPQLKATVFAVNDDEFSRAGPRVLLAARQLCSQLQPSETEPRSHSTKK